MTEKENILIPSLLSLEEKKLFKKYIEEYNDLYQKILILTPTEFITKLNSLVEYSLRSKNNTYSKKTKEKIEEIITEKYYKIDYKIAQKIKSKIKNDQNKEIFEGSILPHCDKDKKIIIIYIHVGKNFLKMNRIKKFIYSAKNVT